MQRFERRLESLISNAFARTFRSAVQPVEIAAALERELDNNAQILSRDKRLVPNTFHVELSQSDLDRLGQNESVYVQEFSDHLHQHAKAQGYAFPGQVAIDFEPADDLPTGRFRIRSSSQAKVINRVTDTQVRRASALLEVNGTTQPLQPPGLVVGRGTDADLRINDPGVSRRHAEFSVQLAPAGSGQPPRIEVRDLGSTNGITVDGQKVPRATLHEGSEVRIGTTTMTVRIVETLEPGGAGV